MSVANLYIVDRDSRAILRGMELFNMDAIVVQEVLRRPPASSDSGITSWGDVTVEEVERLVRASTRESSYPDEEPDVELAELTMLAAAHPLGPTFWSLVAKD